MTSDDIAIKVENLSKCYQIYAQPRDRLKQFVMPRLQRSFGLPPKQYCREFWALKDVSFEVKKGETVGIVGRNGSGKSTLLQMICGTLNPTQGRIRTSGRIAALLELGSGFNPEFTGRENVYLNGAILGLSREEIDERFESIVGFADIGDFIERPVKTYSSGMMLRLAFSVAVNVDPEVLVIDEALAVGDELFQRKCFSRLETVRANGATVLFVSHSGAQVVELCDRAILLDTGELIAAGTSKGVVSHYQRLLYAPEASRSEVRNQIINNVLMTGGHREEARRSSDEEVPKPDDSNSRHDGDETFDPYLVPATTVEYESHGPVIDTPSLFTEDGRKVNGLVRGKTYLYRYRVRFERSASIVRFGMSIKSTTGISLVGSLSAPGWSSAIPVVEQGETVDVEFKFDCRLNPGVYFMNAGVFGVKGGEECVLHRRADVLAFRVLPEVESIETETVYSGVQAIVRAGAVNV